MPVSVFFTPLTSISTLGRFDREPLASLRGRHAGGRGQLEILAGEIAENGLLLFANGVGAACVIVTQIGRFRDVLSFELLAMLFVGRPLAVRRFVVGHDEERLVLGPVLQHVNRNIGNNVRGVAVG